MATVVDQVMTTNAETEKCICSDQRCTDATFLQNEYSTCILVLTTTNAKHLNRIHCSSNFKQKLSRLFIYNWYRRCGIDIYWLGMSMSRILNPSSCTDTGIGINTSIVESSLVVAANIAKRCCRVSTSSCRATAPARLGSVFPYTIQINKAEQ